MEYNYTPFQSLNNIRLDANRSDIIALLGNEYESFQKTQFDPVPSDSYYKSLGLIFHYDSEYFVDAIEVFPSNTFIYNNINLFSFTYQEAKEILIKESCNFEEEKEEGIIFFDLGIGLSMHDSDDDKPSVCIIVFKKDYYNE
ncbi:MAG: hypothetical protein M0D57_14155 [Sphingobacteriales bacterium JAD_PAG50586_3]|nr:MAG: hypothetical protein M0D57_14155 [Sphingobacteriales bacterium JAD_PAG50586_3]